MGKRSDFARNAHDDYPTPPEAVRPLVKFLDRSHTILDPCSSGPRHQLFDALAAHGFDVAACGRREADARHQNYYAVDTFVTNPPWTQKILAPIIVNLSNQRPTWMLLSADWMHTLQARPFLCRLARIVSIGRVKWFPDSPHISLDNCAWYLFDEPDARDTIFHGRS